MKGAEIWDAGLLEEHQVVSDLFNEDAMAKALAGEMLMEIPVLPGRPRRSQFSEDTSHEDYSGAGAGRELNEIDVINVEEKLKKLCGSILAEWKSKPTLHVIHLGSHCS